MIKNILITIGIASVAALVYAASPKPAETKSCCANKAVAASTGMGQAVAAQKTCGDMAKAQCGMKAVSASVEKDDACATACADKAMVNGKEACCKSTAAKPMAKGDKGCCNNPAALAKFKVYVDGKYKYFGCEGSATKGRKELMAKEFNVGPVQKVSGKIRIDGKRVA